MNANENLIHNELQIDLIGYSHLFETAKWGKFVGIVGFILTGVFVIIALLFSNILNNIKYGNNSNMLKNSLLTSTFLVIAVINFYMSLFLFRFSVKMKSALLSTNQYMLNNSLQNLKNLYKLIGILIVTYIAIIPLSVLYTLLR